MRSALVILLFMPNVLAAQDTLSGLRNSIPIRKNEFGATVTPLVSMLIGKDLNDIPYGLQYKRWIGGDIWFTVDGHIETHRNFLQFAPTTYVIDSLHFNQVNNYKSSTCALASGIEIRRYTRRGITFGSGVQATWKNGFSRNFQETHVSTIDSVTNPGTAFPLYHINHDRAEVHSEEYFTTNYFGITLSGLVMIPVGQKWRVNGRYRLTGFAGKQKSLEVDHVAGTITRNNASLLLFEAPRPTVELAVMYRF